MRYITLFLLLFVFASPANAQKVSALGAASALTGAEIFVCDQSSVTVGCTANQIRTLSSVYPSAALTGTPAAGANEYDGISAYFAPSTTWRGNEASVQIATVATGAKTALTNSITTAQSIFAGANDTFTVAANTSYRFRAHIMLNTGATSHTTAFVLTPTTTTFASVEYSSIVTSSAAATLATPQMLRVGAATSTVLNAASTAVTTDIVLDGIFRTTLGGTIAPQIAFSAGPTGTCEVEVASYFEVWPVGTDAMVSVGVWN